MRSWPEDLDWFEDLVDFVLGLLFMLNSLFLILVLGLLLLLSFHLFPVAPLFLWVLVTYPILSSTLSLGTLQL